MHKALKAFPFGGTGRGLSIRSLKYIVTPQGRAVKNGSSWVYEYNLTDHLGNVRVVIKKGTNGLAEIIQQKAYYSFGMEISQFSAGTGTSKNWYNGKEIQDDFGLYWYDYGARFYDPGLGRWHNVDPLAEKYYFISPFAYSLNNPIRFVDPDGKIVKPAPGSNPTFIQNFKAASDLLIEKRVGSSYQQLVKSKEVYYVKENGESRYDGTDFKNKTINWNPSSALEVNGKIVLSPTGVFGHEIEHAANHDNALKAWYNGDQETYYKWEKGTEKNTSKAYLRKEEENVITGPEQKIAKALGSINDSETTRNAYIGQMVRVDGINSTEKLKSLQPIKTISPVFTTNDEYNHNK